MFFNKILTITLVVGTIWVSDRHQNYLNYYPGFRQIPQQHRVYSISPQQPYHTYVGGIYPIFIYRNPNTSYGILFR